MIQVQRLRVFCQIKKMRDKNKKSTDSDPASPGPRQQKVLATIAANEAATLATLKNLASSQAQLQASGIIDINGNGAGEYGFCQDLTGSRVVHGMDPKAKKKIRVSPPILPRSFAKTDADGCIQRSGYFLRIFLPGSKGKPVHEKSPHDPFPSVGASDSEVLWCAYAWPVARGRTGQRTFFINMRGDALASENSLMGYSGKSRIPSPHAALRIDFKDKQALAANLAIHGGAFDGARWRVTN